MNDKKRDSIINAALNEFSEKGYALASTNVIVRSAGISKGALFHYFESKKELYHFLCDYVFDIVKNEFYEKIEHSRGDLIARLGNAARLKGMIFTRYPTFFDFTKRLATEMPEVLGEAGKEKVAEITSIGYRHIMDGLDYSLFREDFPVEKVRDLIMWSLEGYGNTLMQRPGWRGAGYDEAHKELEAYLRILRKCYYKEEVL